RQPRPGPQLAVPQRPSRPQRVLRQAIAAIGAARQLVPAGRPTTGYRTRTVMATVGRSSGGRIRSLSLPVGPATGQARGGGEAEPFDQDQPDGTGLVGDEYDPGGRGVARDPPQHLGWGRAKGPARPEAGRRRG